MTRFGCTLWLTGERLPCWFVGSYGIVQAIAATTGGRLVVRIQVAIESPRQGCEGGVAIYYTTPQNKERLILCHSLERTRETNYDTNYYD
jgi:hypothetical protein